MSCLENVEFHCQNLLKPFRFLFLPVSVSHSLISEDEETTELWKVFLFM